MVEYFSTIEDAEMWMDKEVNDSCVDNERFAYLDLSTQVEDYLVQKNSGCCGEFDALISIGGKLALIGCNYGH